MSEIKSFFLNEQEYCTTDRLSILQLVEYFNYNDSLIVLEYNNLVWSNQSWNKTFIKDQDKIEIVTIVGGG